MFRNKAYFPLLALSITGLCAGAIVFYGSSSNWLMAIMGVTLWLAGCAMMIAWCVVAVFRDAAGKSENQAHPRPVPLKKAS